ncbi:MAG: hypothetical protein ABI261_02635 [Ginsengibacter sp.]
MKKLFYKFLPFLLVFSLAGCQKRNYFPDQDDPGLSRFTSYGFNIGTFYLNNVPYINPFRGFVSGNSIPTISKIITNSTLDTLNLSWQIGINNNGDAEYNSPYQMVSLLMPVPKSFTKADFIAMSGQQFASNTNEVILQASYYGGDTLSGLSNIYFVKINLNGPNDSTIYLELSGLFNGNIGDSILITKGRFDFQIDESSLNF